MNLLSIFRRSVKRDGLQAAQEAHEIACAVLAARKCAGDTRGQHEAQRRVMAALHERMRLENSL